MSLRIGLLVRYLSAILLPLAVFLLLTLPQKEKAKAAQDTLAHQGGQLMDASRQILESLPPPKPGIPRRLDAVGGLKVHGLKVKELSRTIAGRPSVRLALRGGYWELVSFLDAAWTLPYPGRAVSLSVALAPEGDDLEGEATMEVEP